MSEQMREEFEAWASKGFGLVRGHFVRGEDEYENFPTQCYWEVWQAARKPVPAIHPLQQCLRDNGDLIALRATVAHQAQMIEHLRGGPAPCYTAVDMTTAAADGRRSLYEHLVERLATEFADSETMMTVECFADWMSKEFKK